MKIVSFLIQNWDVISSAIAGIASVLFVTSEKLGMNKNAKANSVLEVLKGLGKKETPTP